MVKGLGDMYSLYLMSSSRLSLFAQDLHQYREIMGRPYVYLPSIHVGRMFRFLKSYKQFCTIIVLHVYPRKYWWPFGFSAVLSVHVS